MSIKILQLEDEQVGDSSYLSCFDPYVQRAFHLSYRFVRRRFLIECLMNDRLFTSLSHILASALSFNIIVENKILLENEVVIPYARQYHSVSEVVRDRLSRYDTDSELYRKWRLPISMQSYMQQIFNEIPALDVTDVKKIAEQKEEFLDSSLGCVVSHPPSPGMDTFKMGVLQDLKDYYGTVKAKTRKKLTRRLINFIDQTVSDRMNRNMYFTIFEKYKFPKEERKQLLDIIIFNYYIGYLSNLKWKPNLNPPFLDSTNEIRLNKLSHPGKKAVILGRTSAHAFEEFIQVSSIPVNFIESLTANDILELRNCSHLKSFRYYVKKLILEFLAPTTETYQVALLQQTSETASEVIKTIRERFRSQTHSMSYLLRFRNFLYTISLFAAGTLLHPALLILLLPPTIDLLSQGGLTHQILARTHKYDLVFLKNYLDRLWLPRLEI